MGGVDCRGANMPAGLAGKTGGGGAGEFVPGTGIREIVCSTSISLMAWRLAASNGLKLLSSNSLRLNWPSGLITFNLSLLEVFVPVSLITGAPSVLLVLAMVVMVRDAGVGVRMVDMGEGMRGGGSCADEDVTFALSATAAASIRLRSSSSHSLFSLACASAAKDMVLTRACSNTNCVATPNLRY